MTEFEGKVLADLSVLKCQMSEVVGIGQAGGLIQLEARMHEHDGMLQCFKGVGGGRKRQPVVQALSSWGCGRERAMHRGVGAAHIIKRMPQYPNPLVGVIMGSRNDYTVMRAAVEILREFGVPHEARVVSAHR